MQRRHPPSIDEILTTLPFDQQLPHSPRLWEMGNLESLGIELKRLVWYIMHNYTIFVGYGHANNTLANIDFL